MGKVPGINESLAEPGCLRTIRRYLGRASQLSGQLAHRKALGQVNAGDDLTSVRPINALVRS